jgi:RNA-directed DNA polymerase
MLGAGVMQNGAVSRGRTGTPQGRGDLTRPCQCLLAPARPGMADTRMRYADDLLVMCKTEQEAKDALTALAAILGELGLQPKQAKTRVVHLPLNADGEERP